MARPPNILIPGLRTRPGISGGTGGVLLGRMSARGPVQLLNAQQQRQLGIRAPSNNQLAHQAGFTFSVGGIPANNEFVGQGSWSRALTFHNSDPNNSVLALSGATGTPSMRMLLADLSEVGSIQFLTPTVGTVVWTSDPYIHPAGVPLLLYCPTPADATLGQISGRVVGYI